MVEGLIWVQLHALNNDKCMTWCRCRNLRGHGNILLCFVSLVALLHCSLGQVLNTGQASHTPSFRRPAAMQRLLARNSMANLFSAPARPQAVNMDTSLSTSQAVSIKRIYSSTLSPSLDLLSLVIAKASIVACAPMPSYAEIGYCRLDSISQVCKAVILASAVKLSRKGTGAVRCCCRHEIRPHISSLTLICMHSLRVMQCLLWTGQTISFMLSR